MGDYLLMKTLLISLSVLLSTQLLCDELSWVDEQVQAIKPARSGMSKQMLASIKSPFIFLTKNRGKEEKKAKLNARTTPSIAPQHNASNTHAVQQNTAQSRTLRKSLSLNAIMNNSAMINDNWYKQGDMIAGYRVQKITYDSVLLVHKAKKLLLTTKSRITTIKIKN